MSSKNYYDVTKWNVGNPYEDIGEVINSIIADIKKRQTDSNMNEGGKPGAVIYIPSGDYHLRTQVVIDISYLKILYHPVSVIIFRRMNGQIYMKCGRAEAVSLLTFLQNQEMKNRQEQHSMLSEMEIHELVL